MANKDIASAALDIDPREGKFPHRDGNIPIARGNIARAALDSDSREGKLPHRDSNIPIARGNIAAAALDADPREGKFPAPIGNSLRRQEISPADRKFPSPDLNSHPAPSRAVGGFLPDRWMRAIARVLIFSLA